MAKPANGWLRLTAPIGLLLAIAAGSGLLVPGLYHDSPYFAPQAVAQDLVSLAVALPLLIATAVLAARGSLRARSLWLGELIYLVYTYAIAAFEVRFNALFLVYVALLGCSLYALIGGLVTTDLPAVNASFSEKAPVKTVSIYLGVLAILFYGLWLSEVIPALIAGRLRKAWQTTERRLTRSTSWTWPGCSQRWALQPSPYGANARWGTCSRLRSLHSWSCSHWRFCRWWCSSCVAATLSLSLK